MAKNGFSDTARLTRRLALAALGTALLLPLPAAVQAQDQPPLKIVVSFGAGGTNDLLARVLAEKLSPRLNRPVIVEPKPGAAGLVAARYVMNLPPDGNTILMTTVSMPILTGKLDPPFDVRKDFTPIIQLNRGTHVLHVNSSVPVKTVAELVAYSKANPDKLSFGSFGIGGHTHLIMELLVQRTGAKLTHVPYRSLQETHLAIVKNEIQVTMSPYASMKALMEDGKVRALAMVSAESEVPGIPGMKAAGIPDFDQHFWFGFHGPAGTPAPVVERLNKAFNEVLGEKEMIDVIARFGAKPVGGTPQDFARAVSAEVDIWKDVIRRGNIQFD